MKVLVHKFPAFRWRGDASKVERRQDFVDRVMQLWDAKHDTVSIAKLVGEHESAVCIALRFGRDQRRGGG